MAIGQWFKRLTGQDKIDNVVYEVVSELLRRYPPSIAAGEGRRLSTKAVTNILEGVIEKAVTKGRSLNLGWFGTARLGNAFRWSLKDNGYPEKFIEVVTEALIVYMTRKK